jgi:hypothetical protein
MSSQGLQPETDDSGARDLPRTGRLLPLPDHHLGQTQGLEQYLECSSVCHARPLAGGGGHPQRHKMTLFLTGGVAVAAKAGADAEMLMRARREVAAWVLAVELGFPWLVPTTVLRKMPMAIGDSTEVDGSVQILWPQFSTALDERIDATYIDEVYAWPVALFDTLIANTDRASDNWGQVKGLPNAVLIDHGHAFAGSSTDSEFAGLLKDRPLSPQLLVGLEQFVSRRAGSRLAGLLDEPETNGVYRRATALADAKTLYIPSH